MESQRSLVSNLFTSEFHSWGNRIYLWAQVDNYKNNCKLPGSSPGRIQGVPSGCTASAREDTRDQPWQGQVCVLLFDNSSYTLTQNVSKVQDAYSCLHRISITSVCFLGRAGCFLLSNSIVNLSTLSSGLGAH